jgi:hypothetical protein
LRFYLGTHVPSWLEQADGPLFVSRRRLIGRDGAQRHRLPRARVPWVLDSGGFSQLSQGAWDLRTRTPYDVTVAEYAAEVTRYADEIGMLDWAAPMDWMCEPHIIAMHRQGVAAHQQRTTRNFLDLRERLGPLVVPVLQGWTLDEYLRHIDAYQAQGVELAAEPVVAVGSVCRRGDDRAIHLILRRLAGEGLALHAFGVRAPALLGTLDCLVSADSLSWSYDARRASSRGEPIDHAHPRGAVSCANCLIYAERWRARTLGQLAGSLFYTEEVA